jgi:hypothetical protein
MREGIRDKVAIVGVGCCKLRSSTATLSAATPSSQALTSFWVTTISCCF